MTPRAESEQGGGAATEAAWPSPCSHHLGDTEGTGDSSRSADTRMPPPRLQPRAALMIAPGPSSAGERAPGTPNSPRLGRWSANFLRVSARSLARGGCREAAPETPRLGGEGRGGRCCGWERRPPRHTRAAPGSAVSEVSALTLPLLWLNCSGFPPPSPRLPVSAPSSRTREHLKGPRGTFQASLYSPDAGLASFAHEYFHPKVKGDRLRPQMRIKLLRIKNPSQWKLALFLSPPLTPLHLSPNGSSQPKTSKILLVQLNLFFTASRSWNKLSNDLNPSSFPFFFLTSNLGKQAFRTGDRAMII